LWGLGVFSIWPKTSEFRGQICVIVGGRKEGQPDSGDVGCGRGKEAVMGVQDFTPRYFFVD
jgi:hypothetical protein